MCWRKDGKSSAILERFSGKFGPVVLDSTLGIILGDTFSKKDSGVVGYGRRVCGGPNSLTIEEIGPIDL